MAWFSSQLLGEDGNDLLEDASGLVWSWWFEIFWSSWSNLSDGLVYLHLLSWVPGLHPLSSPAWSPTVSPEPRWSQVWTQSLTVKSQSSLLFLDSRSSTFPGRCGILTTNLCLYLDHQGFLYICLLLSGVESSFQVCSIDVSGVNFMGDDYCISFNQFFPNSPRSTLCSSRTSESRSSILLPSSPSLVFSSVRNKISRFYLVVRFHCCHPSFYEMIFICFIPWLCCWSCSNRTLWPSRSPAFSLASSSETSKLMWWCHDHGLIVCGHMTRLLLFTLIDSLQGLHLRLGLVQP